MTKKINVEGGEIVQYAGKQPVKVSGPSHEKGGVDIPDGSVDIFSKRVSLEGATMAERKERRMMAENNLIDKINKFKKTLSKDPTNIATKTSIDRTTKALMLLKANNIQEEASDLAIMNYINNQDSESDTYAAGGSRKKKFKDLGLFEGDGTEPKSLLYDTNNKSELSNIIEKVDATSYSGAAAPVIDIKPLPSSMETKATAIAKDMQYSKSIKDDTTSNSNNTEDIGKLGTYIKGIAPAVFSLLDAVSTKSNVNAYADVGKDALNTIDAAARQLHISNELDKRELMNNAISMKRQANTSARSLAVVNALKLATDLKTNDAIAEYDSNLAKNTSNLLGNKANIELNVGQIRAQGADAKQIADKQDISAIINNSSAAAQGLGSSYEHLGKMINSEKYNEDFLSILNSMSPNVQFVFENGKIVMKPKT